MRKTKIMISGVDLQTLKDSGKYPCSVCRKSVGSYSIYCDKCVDWAHKKCSGIIGRLKPNPNDRCNRCKGTARTIDRRPYNEWLYEQDKKLDLIDSFFTLEIQSVLEVVVILVLSREFNVRGVSFGNSCQYQLHVFFCTPHVSKYTAYTSVLSCYTVRVGHPVSTTC